jgi:shikimate dehydrogenase
MKKIIFGLIGNPVKHSLSPAMHNAAFGSLNKDSIYAESEYRLFELSPEDLEKFLLGEIAVKDTKGNEVDAKDVAGFNITIPYKIKAREILEKRFPFDQKAVLVNPALYYVKFSGAVNTVKREGNIPRYWNTDAPGFLKSLTEDLKFVTKDKNVLIVGCGGAGRAVIAALSWKNVLIRKIYITDIDQQAIDSAKEHFLSKIPQSKYLPDKLEFISISKIETEVNDCDLLVNATPIGMEDANISVIDKSLLQRHKNLSVYDVVYNRKQETKLIKDAKSLGLPAKSGLSMLLYQGANSFNLWTGQEAPITIMREALDREVEKIC